MPRVTLNSGELLWSGEHWIVFLREEGASSDSAKVSLYHTRWSPAGEGNVALIRHATAKEWNAVVTDNRELAAWIAKHFFVSSDYYDPALPVVDGVFSRLGDIREEPMWLIGAGDRGLMAGWKVKEPPVIASGEFSEGHEHFTILCFTDEAWIEVGGKPVPGRPYPRDIWKPSIGGERSSCVFALAETFLKKR